MLEKLKTSYHYVTKNAKHVKINYQEVDKMVEKIEEANQAYWLKSNPFGLLDMKCEEIIDFLLIYHTVGNYCFWGEPKWEIETPNGKLDGSYAMMYLLINPFQTNPNFDMSRKEFKDLLKGNVEIPLFEDRYESLIKMNQFLQKENKPFHEIINGITQDEELLEFIIENLSYFRDVSTYEGKEIYFYKRAQLLTSDILHILEIKKGIKVDYSNLIGCADYKIPQVMRCYKMLEFDTDLATKVDKKECLMENSQEEIEIRASNLEVIDYIYQKTNKKYTKMNINDFLWIQGQNKEKMTKPYHRTITNHY